MIPKTMFFYWGGEKLSYLRLLSIHSFHKLNPEWDIKIYVPSSLSKKITWGTKEQSGKYTGEDYLLKSNYNVIPFDFTAIGISNDTPEVYKSDLLRYYLLYKYGGFFSDTDIIYFKPMEVPEDCDTIVCYHRHFSIGLVGSCKENIIYGTLLHLGRQDLDSKRNYQAVGTKLFRNLTLPKLIELYPELKFHNLPMDVVYPVLSDKLEKIFENNKNYTFPDESIGLHWFGGSPESRVWENKITPMKFDYDNILGKALMRFKEWIKKH